MWSNADPKLYQVRNNPLHGRYPSDPDTRQRMERVIEGTVEDRRPSILYPLVLLGVIALCVAGMVYVVVYGV